MSTTTERIVCLLACALAMPVAMAADGSPYGFGRTPTADELSRFTSPLPDGRGLPAGRGSVADGEKVYQAQCVACHGQALQGGLGDRLVGGRGTLVNADPTKAPIKTVESYWPYTTTLFDYIKRAMPLMAPGSLSDDDVYAVTAYILSQAKIIGSDAVMDGPALTAVRMPNRDGFIPDSRPDRFPPVAKSPHAEQAIAAPVK